MTETTDLVLVAQLLAGDPVWSAYAIADLQPAMAPYCRWFAHTSSDGDARDGDAVVLLFDGLEPPALFAEGDPAALEAVLSCADLPPRVYLTMREEHVPIIARRYDHHDRRHMWRMVLGEARGEGRVANAPLRRLTAADVPQVRSLLAHGGPFTPDAFAEYQITQGVFFGVEDGAGGLAAVGGTHIVDYTRGVAAIGNMYTRPDCRGRGYAGAVLAAIVAEVRANGATTIVLNVDQRNTGARRLYEQHSFTVHCPYIEGVATARV